MPIPFEQATFVFVSSRVSDSLGRAERRFLAVLPALLGRGSAVLVMAPPASPFSAKASVLGASVVDTILDPGHYLRGTKRVHAHLQRHRPVCVHSAGLAADLACRRAARGLPAVAVVNTIPCGAWPRGGALVGWLDRRTLGRADRLLVDCEALGRELVALGAPASNIVYDPPSVDVARVIADAGHDLAIPPSGRPVVGFAGRLEHSRGVGSLLDAAETLWSRGVDIEVCVAGEGPELAAVRARAADLAAAAVRAASVASDAGLEPRVRILGAVGSVPAVLRSLDICVFPSTGGGAPTALLEAAVLGRAIVAAAVPGIEGLFIDGEEIVLVPPGDVEALADAVQRLATDHALAAELGRRARLRALDEYSATAAVDRRLALYRTFLAR